MFRRLLQAMGLARTPSGKPKRSSQWPKVRAVHLTKEPTCQACGSDKKLEVHHIKPYHRFPAEELNPNNLLTLCEGDVVNCHLMFGLRNFESWNSAVREDAAAWLTKIKNRPR